MNDVVLFWLLLFALNTIYFLPRYILEKRSAFFPIRGLVNGSFDERLQYVLIRPNYDIFRISIDFCLLVFLFAFFLRQEVSVLAYSIVLFLYFMWSLAYQVYFTVFNKLYKLEPVLFNDAFMLMTAVRIFFGEYDRKNILITLGTVVFGFIAFALIYALSALARVAEFGTVSYIAAALIGVLGLYSVVQYSYAQFPQLTFQSQVQSLIRNLIRTKQARRDLRSLTLQKMKGYNVSSEIRLAWRPNIYLIVVESYGRVLMDSPELKSSYTAQVRRLDRALQAEGWHVASHLSRSPVTGGASWISYTSILYGLNVKSQGVFLTLLRNPCMPEYDSMFHWLRRQGYTTFRLSSLGGYEKMDVPYESYSRMYGFDHWIRHKDLGYRGREYGFGPSPPDQYALHFAHEKVRNQCSGPFALFFITQNSHTPYETPVKVVKDWRALNDDRDENDKRSKIWSRPRFENYARAIDYQLEYLSDFIIRKGSNDDLFILIGDHQPPSISIEIESFETPVHILSKNRHFIRLFREYGFAESLMADTSSDRITHGALYWAFLRSLIRTSSRQQGSLPEFLPNGIPYT